MVRGGFRFRWSGRVVTCAPRCAQRALGSCSGVWLLRPSASLWCSRLVRLRAPHHRRLGPRQALRLPAPHTGQVTSTIDCNVTDDSDPPPDYTIVGNAIALFLGSDTSPLSLEPAGETSADVPPYFAKSGIAIRVGKRWRLTVPASAAQHLRIGWGSPAGPGSTVLPPHCDHQLRTRTGWIWFPGGYWSDQPGCYPLIADVEGSSHHLQLQLGGASVHRRPMRQPRRNDLVPSDEPPGTRALYGGHRLHRRGVW